jgi:hypothetical protein
VRSTDAVNCRLLKARGASTGDEYDAGIGSAADGAEKWAGDVGAYYEESRQRTVQNGAPQVVVWRSLVVREELGVDWAAQDTVEFRRLSFGAPASESGRIKAVELPESPPGSGGEVRLTLETT